MSESAVTKIGEAAFLSCTKLKTVTFSKKLTTISGYAFQGASALTSVKLNKVTKIGTGAFAISGLKSVTITKCVTSIGTSAFANCSKLTKISVSGSNTKYSSKDGVLYNKAKTKLIQYPLGKSGSSFTIPSSVKKIAAGAFYGNTKLKSVEIGAKVTEIGEEAFANCTALTSISIPDNVTTIESLAFAWCSKLKTVTIGTGIETIEFYAFYDCSALKTVTFKGAAPEFAPGSDTPAIFGSTGKSVTIKYPSSEKSSRRKSLRSTLKTASKNYGCATLTFKSC